ncbi:MAG: Gfo/Idh/MocA family oxidoreductase [Bryobacteraceae bacterium]|nr:Gfo/Idh/MocA family oxidoreductase [Bryobacteraceae bacterium]
MSTRNLLTRRTFAITAASAAGAIRVSGANDRIRIGLIGCGGRGRYVAECIRDAGGVDYTATCDVYQKSADAAKEWAGGDAQSATDFRRVLERKDIDAVHIATPDHWHSALTILGCQAGKDIYVEKPVCHNVAEGRAMVTAARQYKRIVFTGTQQRSAPHFAEVAKIIQGGQIGPVHLVRVWNFNNMLPDGIGVAPDSNPPPGLDWDMYCGPAPKRPFNVKRFQSTFRWFRDYAGGTITDYGTHRFDTVHQIMGVDQPKTISASGGRYALKDAGEMPDVLQVTYEYPGFVLSYEACNISAHGLGGRTPGMRYYNAKGSEDRPNGMAFYGTYGALFTDRIGYEIYPDGDKIQRVHVQARDATPIHGKRFVEALRARSPLNADIENGHRATAIGLLGNIAYLTGEKLIWNAVTEKTTSAAANKLLRREPRKPYSFAS